MNDANRSADPNLVKQALLQIRELRAKLAEVQSERSEPIAIVGAGLRLPGGIRTLDQLSVALAAGFDAVTDIPPDRWDRDAYYDSDPDAPGRTTTRLGAFLDEIDRFDAEFFGISPHEAARMDPQQRVVLEVAWEALENAAIPAASLDGTPVGVFLGISNGDYGRALLAHPEQLDVYASTGNAYSVAAGRLAYALGLTGPSIAIDTACSSSLVALHLAGQSLRQRECDIALAGGVNLILTPEMNIIFSHGRMMASDGRCKTFDAAADGYVRAEGCGMLALRRLSDAARDGDRILGVMRGSAVNQDGRSGGLTAPNGPAQTAVIRAALRAGGVSPGDVSYLEAHGTGTPLGDPIEVGAITEALCADRTQPLLLGSVKTNIGHLEAAAGVAGVLKVLAALDARQIPPHLHFQRGNSHIDWSAPILVPTTPTSWQPANGSRIAGVSSFGFAGCNAHVVIEEPPAVSPSVRAGPRSADLLCLSARDSAALHDVASHMRDRLADATPEDVADICFSAHVGRSAFAHRLAVCGEGGPALVDKLEAFLEQRNDDGIAIGDGGRSRPKVGFIFTGQGGQYAGMAKELYASCPVFRSALDECGRVLSPLLGLDFLATIFDAEAEIDDVGIAQPATFAVQHALAQMWRALGVEPAVVLGHSTGEYAAACVAGILLPTDALGLIAERGRLTAELARPGSMAAVFAPSEDVVAVLADIPGHISIAAYNGPEHVVVSGEHDAVARAMAVFEARGRRVKSLRVIHPAHSALIEPVLEPFRSRLVQAAFAAGAIPFVSGVTGSLAADGETASADYWCNHMRQPVRFMDAVRSAAATGVTHWLEIGPHAVLLPLVLDAIAIDERNLLPSLHRDRSDWSVVSDSVGRLYADGAEIAWGAFHQEQGCRRVALPSYPFRRRRHWAAVLERAGSPAASSDEWHDLCTAMDRQAGQGPLDLNVGSYAAKWACLGRLVSAHAVRTLRESRLFATAGERKTVEEVMATTGINPMYGKLLARWLDGLVADGLLIREGGAFVARSALPEPALPAIWEECERLFADNRPLLAYVTHCAGLLGPVLRGQVSPLESLFPQGSTEIAEALYERSATMRYINALAAAALRVLSQPGERALRVLEVGAGTGGTTSALLDALGPRSHYTFSDVSRAFFDRASERFGSSRRRLSFATFDFDKDPAAQGFASASFDVIAAANTMHASADLRSALARLRTLLAPGGVLILVESTVHFKWFDMTTGLIEGWQHFADDLRSDNPLLDVETWHHALAQAGFAEVQAWPRAGAPAEVLGQHVIVARVAGERAARQIVEAAEEDEAIAAAMPATSSIILAQLREAYPSERLELVRDYVRKHVMRILDLPADTPPGRDSRLMDLGLDSLMAVRLRGVLARELGITLPASLVFDYPTIDAIAGRVLESVVSEETTAPQSMPEPPDPARRPPGGGAVPTDEEIEAILMGRSSHG